MFVIYGTKGLTKEVGAGKFFCPSCWGENRYRQQAVKRWFTLYFIPLIPLNTVGEYVECSKCRGTFGPDVHQFNPEAAEQQAQEFEAEFRKVMRRTMAMMALADGVIEPEEIEMMRGIYSALAGKEMTAEQAQQVIDQVGSADEATLVRYLKTATADLNENGRELVLRAAMQIAASDGDFAAEERELLEQIGHALEMKKRDVARIINDELQASGAAG